MRVVIGDDTFWKAKEREHLFPIEFGDPFCIDCFVTWDEDCRFTAVIINDGKNGIKAIGVG
jgi:hypothetical protein